MGEFIFRRAIGRSFSKRLTFELDLDRYLGRLKGSGKGPQFLSLPTPSTLDRLPQTRPFVCGLESRLWPVGEKQWFKYTLWTRVCLWRRGLCGFPEGCLQHEVKN